MQIRISVPQFCNIFVVEFKFISCPVLANLHNWDRFCTGKSDIQCVTPTRRKSPVPHLSENTSGRRGFLMHSVSIYEVVGLVKQKLREKVSTPLLLGVGSCQGRLQGVIPDP
jgi:hypothetical protein